MNPDLLLAAWLGGIFMSVVLVLGTIGVITAEPGPLVGAVCGVCRIDGGEPSGLGGCRRRRHPAQSGRRRNTGRGRCRSTANT